MLRAGARLGLSVAVRVWGLTPGVHAGCLVLRVVSGVRVWGLTQNVHHR